VIVQRDPLSALLKLAPSPVIRCLFDKQRAALWGSRRFRSWLAGRRAGKSFAAAAWLLGGAAGQISIYCSRTLKSAKGIMIAAFRELNARFQLGLDIRASTGTITEPSGHVIQFYGLRDAGAADLIRGLSKLRRAFIDEGGTFTDDLLKYAIESVIQPILLDLKGDMCLAGTPGVIPKGYFFDISGNPGAPQLGQVGRWQTHHWTYESNPHIPAELVLQEAFEANGWTPQHATFMREYGAIWCEDAESIIYRYKGERWASPPESGVTVMALDFGVVDQTAWAIGRQAYDQRPHMHVLKAHAQSNVDLPEIARITREFRERFNVNRIIADEGALGKALANNLRNQYHLPIEAVPKQHKRAKIDIVRGRLAAGTIHLCEEASPLADEWQTLCWNLERDDHHERQLDDLSDVTCYLANAEEFSAWEFPVPPKVVSLEHERMKLAAMQRALRGPGLGSF
jgi:hypothetical protein